MGEHTPVVTFMLEWVWAPMVVALAWVGNRLLNLEARHRELHGMSIRENAIMQNNQQHIVRRLDELEARNLEAHNKMSERLDKHHSAISGRVDDLIKLIRNGHN